MTNRVVIAAENRSLSLGLTGLDCDVVDLRPDQLDAWLQAADGADVLVVGVDDPVDALDLAHLADSQRPGLPVLLVAGGSAGWASVGRVTDLNAELLPLPVTRLTLVAAVKRLMDVSVEIEPEVEPAPEPEPEPEPAPEPAPEAAAEIEVESAPFEPPVDEQPASSAEPQEVLAPASPEIQTIAATAPEEPATAPPANGDAPPVRHMVAARTTDALRERLAHLPPRPPESPESFVEDLRATADVVETPAAREARAPRGAAEAAPAPDVTAETVAAERLHHVATPVASVGEVRQLVHGLLACVDQLYDVRDAADALVQEAATATGATSGVVMLPDGDVWRVCGATGVRPLEWRYIVEHDSWMAATVVDGDRGVIVEDSDIARQRLGGAPLAHHKQLMAAPIAAPRGLIILARDDEPFNETELTRLASLAADAGNLLAEALSVRALARALSEYRALDD